MRTCPQCGVEYDDKNFMHFCQIQPAATMIFNAHVKCPLCGRSYAANELHNCPLMEVVVPEFPEFKLIIPNGTPAARIVEWAGVLLLRSRRLLGVG